MKQRRHEDNIPQGTKVECNGYPGVIVRQYDGDTYEVRVPGGVVATDDFVTANEAQAKLNITQLVEGAVLYNAAKAAIETALERRSDDWKAGAK